MNTVKSLFFAIVAILVALITSCSVKKSDTSTEQAKNEPVVLTVDSLLQSAEALCGQDITVEGVCTHVCQHGGQKLFLMGSNDQKTIRVDADEKIGKFNNQVINGIVSVKGTLTEDKIDEAYLVAWEESIKSQTEEKHGEGEAGCSTEKKAQGEEEEADTAEKRIADFRTRIAKRNQEEGKNYLSFYHIVAHEYEVK